jgi:hypothetical protein
MLSVQELYASTNHYRHSLEPKNDVFTYKAKPSWHSD